MSKLRIPSATYRLQFSREFRFADAQELVPYLHQLGISDLYSSPRFRPRRGSSHGYDVTSPDRVNADLGTEADFDDLGQRLKNYDLGLLLDIVPNHMAASHENPWWESVLEHGPASEYADYFDIDWHPKLIKPSFLQDGKVLVPVLGDVYGELLGSGQLTLGLEETGFYLAYWERRFPIDSGACSPLLIACADAAAEAGLPTAEATLRSLVQLSDQIGPREDLSREQAAARVTACRELEQRLFLLYRDDQPAHAAIDRALDDFSADPDRMHGLLERQAYRLAHWRIASEEINYRRFFDINDLVSLRVELPHVFEVSHATIRELVRAGKVTGLRVDHIDGLYEPRAYLNRLQQFLGAEPGGTAIYTVIEKILSIDEDLPAGWLTAGTTGYDFLNAVNDLFVDPQGLALIEAAHRETTGDDRPFPEMLYAASREVMRHLFAGEVERLTVLLASLAARHRVARDLPVSELRAALVEVTACLPVYRTYANADGLDASDRRRLERTLELARQRIGDRVNVRPWEFLREVLLLEPPAYDPELHAQYLNFLRTWQQFTGPVMAKGLEDTVFYRHTSLISRNEVGGDPLRETPPLTAAQVHEFFARKQQRWPHSLNTTSTHDTKRSEDVRARIDVLSELGETWVKTLDQWRRLNRPLAAQVGSHRVPSPDEETLIYQTLLGAWPLPGPDPQDFDAFSERVGQSLRKSLREAKLHSDWLNPDDEYESAVLRFAEELIRIAGGDPAEPSGENGTAKRHRTFRRSFERLRSAVAYHGAWNSLSQLAIKATAPGVPDLYQGNEVWTYRLVDPDNRAPVDYATRREALHELQQVTPRGRRAFTQKLTRQWADGRIKLLVTNASLSFRRDRADLFESGTYLPVAVEGERSECVFAFARHLGNDWTLTVAPRMTKSLVTRQSALGTGAKWGDTRLILPAGCPSAWTHLFTGAEVPASIPDGGGTVVLDVAAALDRFPVAILHATADARQ